MFYPKGSVPKRSSVVLPNYANRGMTLEHEINDTNQYYQDHDLAYIHKKPTPIKITKVSYPSRQKAVIREAFFDTPSTTDYNGLYKGHYVDFEAKETKSKTSFPLDNIHSHQINHIRNILRHQGIAFLIIRFSMRQETYYLRGEDFITFIDTQKRRSIPYSYFTEKGYLIKDKFQPRIDYLEILDQIMEG